MVAQWLWLLIRSWIGRGSLVVMVPDSCASCLELVSMLLKTCRVDGQMHVKSEAQCAPVGLVVGRELARGSWIDGAGRELES
ncbi:hypothetical protein TNCV_4775881 [Trichonephila clavipes]|nr:hypothetical protein TNCV_4775881 [Trichonephila clavipes]